MRALCIESTGTGTVIPAAVLAEVERRTGRPIAELFDLIVGSSAGVLLALMLAQPDPNGRPRFSAAEAQRLCETELPSVVSNRSTLARYWPSTRLSTEWDDARFYALTDRFFGKTQLEAAITTVAVPLYELRNRQPLLFLSTAANDNLGNGLSMAELARGAVAMPPYSEPVRIADPRLKRSLTVIDGSIDAAPAAVAFRLALADSSDQMLIVSMSDGKANQPLDEHDWSGPRWSGALYEIARDGQAEFADGLLRGILGPERYLRMEPSTDGMTSRDPDDRGDDIAVLRDRARRLISERSSDIEALCAQLGAAVSARA